MRIVSLLVGCALLAGCSDLGFDVRSLTDLERARSRWERTRPNAYVYAIERLCFCPVEYIGPVRVRVQGDTVLERVYVDSGSPVPSGVADFFPTVDGLFAILADAYSDDADDVRVTYDPVTGVPVDFFIDYMEMAADEELGMRVTEDVVATGP
ncbi:MAG: hypothetical protein FJ207_02800 [Gemmatimonadetes bacterium]|nr:hypothetical protein [Gemmatimonadota bacterium]